MQISKNTTPRGEEKTLKLLKKHAIDVLETRHGNITLISDGKNLELRQKVRH